MSEQICHRCGEHYNGSSEIEHECLDERVDNHIYELENRIDEISDSLNMLGQIVLELSKRVITLEERLGLLK